MSVIVHIIHKYYPTLITVTFGITEYRLYGVIAIGHTCKFEACAGCCRPFYDMAVSLFPMRVNDWIYGSLCQCFWHIHRFNSNALWGKYSTIWKYWPHYRWQVLFCAIVYFMLMSFLFVCFVVVFFHMSLHTHLYQCYIIQSVPFCVSYIKHSLSFRVIVHTPCTEELF